MMTKGVFDWGKKFKSILRIDKSKNNPIIICCNNDKAKFLQLAPSGDGFDIKKTYPFKITENKFFL